MSAIDIMVPANEVFCLHLVLAERLTEKGHDVALVGVDAPGMPSMLNHIFFLERKILGARADGLLTRAEEAPLSLARSDADLRIDLSGGELPVASPILKPRCDGCNSLSGAARVLMLGRLPDVEIILDGKTRIACAAPMVDSRISIVRGLNDILARMVTLLVDTADRYLKGEMAGRAPVGAPAEGTCPTTEQLIGAYLFSAMPRQATGIARRLAFNVHRWRVSYRFHNGERVADTGLVSSEGWEDLPDEGKRFYADPFPFEWEGRYFIFVEDFPHGASKAVISVVEVFPDRPPTASRVVLDEPHHLSYPQVFSHAGQIWMLPEGGSGGNLVLYRAEPFPDRWVRHAVLIPDRELFDATLLEHGGLLWLFASERDGYGSASDTLVVYSAPSLEGPWIPHPGNPVRIDRAAARPGGRFVRVGERIVLPLQDGSEDYGGGLGLADLLELDETKVRLTRPVPILAWGKIAHPKIHTLNSSEHLEVIDCLAPAPRLGLRRVA